LGEADSQEPHKGEGKQRELSNQLGPGSNDLGENSQFVLEWSLLVVNSEFGIALFSFSELDLLEDVFADGKDYSLSGAGHDDGVSQEHWVWVCLVSSGILVGALLLSVVVTVVGDVVVALVDEHIHLLNEQAVGWDAVASFKDNDVTNNKIGGEDLLGGSILASEDGNFLVLNLSLELKELSLFSPVTESLDQAGENDCKVDREALNPLVVGSVGSEGEQEEHGGHDEQKLHVKLVKLVPEDGPERADIWDCFIILAKEFSSSL